MKRCDECHKILWPWQSKFRRITNILSKEKPIEIFYYHSKCKQFGEILKD